VKTALEDLRQQRLAGKNVVNNTTGKIVSASAPSSITPSLRPNGNLGRFSSLQATGIRQPGSSTWREQWPESQQKRVV
jgi:hypothetical protein